MGKIHLGGEIWQLFVETHLSKLTMRIMLVIAGTIIVLRAIYDLTKDVNGFLLWMMKQRNISETAPNEPKLARVGKVMRAAHRQRGGIGDVRQASFEKTKWFGVF